LLITARLQRATNLVNLYQFLGGGWIEHAGDEPRPPDETTDYDPSAYGESPASPARTIMPVPNPVPTKPTS
jgi:multidrug efflux system outer membrane protein